MSTDTELAITLAERLVDRLRYGGTSGALTAIEELQKAFPALTQQLQETRRQEMEEAIAAAAGNARTHDWTITDSGIDCKRCNLGTVDYVLRLGALPECGQGPECSSFARGHLVLMGSEDSKRCTYCSAVFPPTAVVEAVTQ